MDTFSEQNTFLQSAKNILLQNDNITCELRDVNGTYIVNNKKIHKKCIYHNINGVLTPENYDNSYFINIVNQLGNCLRIITSGLIIADACNKHAFICIKNDYLHENEIKIITTLFRQYIIFDKFKFNELTMDSCVKNTKPYCTNYNLINEGTFEPPEDLDKYGIVRTIYALIPKNMSDEEFTRRKINIYKSLPYPAELLQNVNSFLGKNDLSSYVGVHIRYTDNLNDSNKLRFNTPCNIFIDKINSLNATNILLCSDNANIKNELKSNSSHRIIFSDNCFNSYFQPLYEMMLLSNCKYIIGTSSSTFSYESAFLKGTNIELFENGEWKLYELTASEGCPPAASL